MNICVYCSANDTIDAKYFAIAGHLGARIAEGGHQLVYGGASVGLMGAVARAVHQGGGRVLGVIPQKLMDRELAYRNADELIVTKGMRERKAMMEARADAFIALPGGIGTLEEVFEIMTLRYLGMTEKPMILLDVDGFYQPLIHLLDHMQAEHFIRGHYHDYLHYAANVDSAFEHIERVRSSQS